VSRALRTLKVLRYIIHPNDAFVQQLKEYDFPALRRKLADADLSLSAMAFYFAQRWSTAVRDLGAKEAGLPDFIRLTDKEAKAQASEWGQIGNAAKSRLHPAATSTSNSKSGTSKPPPAPMKRAAKSGKSNVNKSLLEEQLEAKARKAEIAAKAKEQVKMVSARVKEMGERLRSAISNVKKVKGRGSWIVPDGEVRFDRMEFSLVTAMFPACQWRDGKDKGEKTTTVTKTIAQQTFGVGKCKGGAQGVKAEVVGLKLTYAGKGKYLRMAYEMKTL